MSRSRRFSDFLLVLLALVVVAFAGAVYVSSKDDVISVPASENAQIVEPETADVTTVVTIVGDSYTHGTNMNSGPTWGEQLANRNGWVLVRDAVNGTGYTNDGGIDQEFETRLPTVVTYDTDLLILAGGYNDTQQSPAAVAAKVRDFIEEYRRAQPTGDIVLFSPFANGNPSRPVLALRDQFKKVAKAEDVMFLDVTAMLSPRNVGADRTHPTDAGHLELANAIGRGLEALGVPRQRAYRSPDR